MRVNSTEAKVMLDGEIIETFVSADDEAGWVRLSADVVKRGKVEIIQAALDASLSAATGAGVFEKPARKSGWPNLR